MHEVEPVAHDDERKLVLELDLLEEVPGLLRVIVIRLAADALYLTDLTRARRSLDVLEVDFRVRTEVDDRAEVVIKTFEALVRLEHLNELDGT